MNQEKIALITGASSEIGGAITKELANQGFLPVLHYHKNLKRVRDLQKELKDLFGLSTMVIQGDITQEEDVHWMVSEIMKKYGHIDLLVNNAALAEDGELSSKSMLEFMEVVETNLGGTFLVSKVVGEEMMQQKNGKIICISSTNALDSYHPCSIDYDASKAGVLSLTKNLAKAFAPYVCVNAVAPGWIETEKMKSMSPLFLKDEESNILLQRFAKPEEVADLVAFLASEKASYINGTVIKIDGGRK